MFVHSNIHYVAQIQRLTGLRHGNRQIGGFVRSHAVEQNRHRKG
jgi:hypothetical protein